MTQQPFSLNAPINQVSFGQVTVALLREMFKRGLSPNVFPIGGGADLNTQKPDNDFNVKLSAAINNAQGKHLRKHTAFKLWHINGALESFSDRGNRLITFQESGQLTPTEINILKQQEKVYVTNRYAQSFFKTYGIDAEFMPLGFDHHNFFTLPRRPSIEGVTSWLLTSKAEHRKHTYRQLALWAKKYGNQKEHRLNLAISNSFLRPEDQNGLIAQALEGKQYWNINPIQFCPSNGEYNVLLQSSEIILCASGSEGFGLPEFHAVGMGAWPVTLKAHSYVDFFNDQNAVMVMPNGMTPIYDNIFFRSGDQFNQGNIFTFDDEQYLAACGEAERRAKIGINFKGLELQRQTYAQAVDVLMKD